MIIHFTSLKIDIIKIFTDCCGVSNEIIQAKSLEKCLAHSKLSTYHHLDC